MRSRVRVGPEAPQCPWQTQRHRDETNMAECRQKLEQTRRDAPPQTNFRESMTLCLDFRSPEPRGDNSTLSADRPMGLTVWVRCPGLHSVPHGRGWDKLWPWAPPLPSPAK